MNDSDSSALAAQEAIASGLYAAWQAGTFVTAPSQAAAGFTKTTALAVAERVRALRIAGGAMPAGYKVGFTNAAVRAQFNAEAPLAAPIYDDNLVAGSRIDAQRFLGPRIEPEVVVGIGAGGQVAWAALGFEIVQSHVADWKFSYLDAIADFGLHAALVVGARRPLSAHDLEQIALLEVRLLRDGEVVERGAGSAVDGGAAGSLDWLRDDLRRLKRELQRGDIVSTGSMTRVPVIAAGERWTLEAAGGELPPLSLSVD